MIPSFRMMRVLLAACLSLFALCVAAPVQADVMPLPGGPRLSDCNKARDPARCEARIRARQACRDKRGDAKRICMDTYVVAPDCARADNPKRCVAQKNAEQACHGKLGKSHKSCMQAELKKKPGKTTPTPAGEIKPASASPSSTTGVVSAGS